MSTKIKIKKKKDGHDILVLAKHPMETGLRTDKKTGKVVPEHFITTMLFEVNGTLVSEVSLGPAVSANPLVSISLPNLQTGDVVSASWVDNQDGSGSTEGTVK